MTKYSLTLVIAMLVYGCTSNSTGSIAGEESVAEETTPPPVEKIEAVVLNPNLASTGELQALGFSDAGLKALLEGRPYLDPLTFLSTLREVVGEEQFEDVKASVFLPMNLNTTAEEDFKMVPKVGDKMAHEFEEYRPYTSTAQFRREIGKYVSDEEVAAYEAYVFVPVNLNTGTKEEILAIPGVGDKMLHEFEEYRPYNSMEQFRREIGKYVDDNELARLERYVTL